MLYDVGWLVLVWVIWIIVAAVVVWLCRVTTHKQQDIIVEQESAIAAWEKSHEHTASAGPDTTTRTPLSAT